MHNFILASGNAHKAEEFAILFDKEILQIESAPEKIEVIEDGETFLDNARKKAQGYYKKFQQPIMSDDSGLVVAALPDELGVQTARFGGEGLTDEQRARLLIEKMQDQSNRDAYFVCVLCFYLSPAEIYFFEGRVNGEIAKDYRGEHGFGYDPVFIPSKHEGNQTLAEIPEWKAANSHRSFACREAQAFFTQY